MAFVDLDARTIFTRTKPNTTKKTYHTFQKNNKKKCDKYIELLERKIKENRIFQKVEKIKKEILEYQKHETRDGEDDEIQQRITGKCKVLEKKTTQLMKSAEK